MGLCTSSSASMETAKLISQDGKLHEFSYPVKVSNVLLKYPDSFICNSDEMEFDGALTAVRDNGELEPGQLYFALPLSKLSRSLSAEEMASLAVKANDALLKSGRGGEKCRCRKTKGFFRNGSGKKSSSSSKVADFELANNNGKRRILLANLSVIPE